MISNCPFALFSCYCLFFSWRRAIIQESVIAFDQPQTSIIRFSMIFIQISNKFKIILSFFKMKIFGNRCRYSSIFHSFELSLISFERSFSFVSSSLTLYVLLVRIQTTTNLIKKKCLNTDRFILQVKIC